MPSDIKPSSDKAAPQVHVFACPLCSFLFRSEPEQVKTGVTCPGCHYLLRVDFAKREKYLSEREMLESRKTPVWEKADEEVSRSLPAWVRKLGVAALVTGFIGSAGFAAYLGFVVTKQKPTPIRVVKTVYGEERRIIDMAEAKKGLLDMSYEEVSDEVKVAMMKPIKGVFEANEPEEMLQHCIPAERLPVLVEKYYKDKAFMGFNTHQFVSAVPIEGNGDWWKVTVHRNQLTKVVYLKKNEAGEYLVDLKALMGLGEMLVSELREERPAEPTLVRGLITRSDYFAGDYRDQKRWACYKLYDPSESAYCYVYLDVTREDIDLELKVLAAKSLEQTGGRIALELKYTVSDGRGRQAELQRVVTEGWFISPEK